MATAAGAAGARGTGSRCWSLATSVDPLGFLRRWVRTWRRRLPGRHGMMVGAGLGSRGKRCSASTEPLSPLPLNPLCLSTKSLSYLRSGSCQAFPIRRSPRCNGSSSLPPAGQRGPLGNAALLVWRVFVKGFNEELVCVVLGGGGCLPPGGLAATFIFRTVPSLHPPLLQQHGPAGIFGEALGWPVASVSPFLGYTEGTWTYGVCPCQCGGRRVWPPTLSCRRARGTRG